jgi:hypothetical protein
MKNNLFKIISIFFFVLITTYNSAYLGGGGGAPLGGGGNPPTTQVSVYMGRFLIIGELYGNIATTTPGLAVYNPGDTIMHGVRRLYDCSYEPNTGQPMYPYCESLGYDPLSITISVDSNPGGIAANSGYLTAPATLGAHTLYFSISGEGNTSSISIPFNVSPSLGMASVSSNIAGAGWTITGPVTNSGSGTFASYSSLPSGSYTITWNAVAGYTTPATQTLTLVAPATISFSGTYVAATPTINLWFSFLENVKTFFVGTVFASVNK